MSEDGKAIKLLMAKETIGFGTRQAGAQMRRKAKNLLTGEPDLPLFIDWNGIQVIASSFADEFVGKMFVELGPISFMARIRQINFIPLVKSIIDKAIMQRVVQTVQGSSGATG
jgi:hypothetical protein